MTWTYDEGELIELIRRKAVEFGEFRLASGQVSPYYLDCRRLTLDARGARVIAAGIWQRLGDPLPDAVGGMAVGAVPIVAALVTMAGALDRPLSGFFVRPQAKGHGTGRRLEGPVRSGHRAVIVEDVVTTGGSSLEAIAAARACGLIVERTIAIVDRQAGAAEAFARVGVRLESLLTLPQLELDRGPWPTG